MHIQGSSASGLLTFFRTNVRLVMCIKLCIFVGV